MQSITSISIRPTVNILSHFRFFSYNEWYALGEFVDNSITSYLQNKKKLNELIINTRKDYVFRR